MNVKDSKRLNKVIQIIPFICNALFSFKIFFFYRFLQGRPGLPCLRERALRDYPEVMRVISPLRKIAYHTRGHRLVTDYAILQKFYNYATVFLRNIKERP